jgi:N-carbamoyl-L-amino-acid hydrolase
MTRRRDALVGAARLIDTVNRIGMDNQPNACATVGLVQVFPNSRNVIPGQVFFTVDFRHPDAKVLARMDQELREIADRVSGELGLEMKFEQIWYSPPVPFDIACVNSVRQAAEAFGYSHRDIVSGAGHDACYISRVAPTSMVFVPCENGISHNEAENAKAEDLAAGCNVLLQAVLERAND